MKRLARETAPPFALMTMLTALPCAATPPTQSSHGYRVFISADMEGVAGAVSPTQIIPGSQDYSTMRKLMTDEVVSAIEGARAGGATEFVVADSHADGENILIDQLPSGVTLVRGSPRPLDMMEGVQHGHFDAAMFVGYHASASSVGGVRAHTFSSARFSNIKVNGEPVSEGRFNALIAATYGVPVILVTGDDVATAEMRAVTPLSEFVAVKQAISFQAAASMTPQDAQLQIREAAERAMRLVEPRRPPTKSNDPVNVEVTFHYVRPAELLAWLPNVHRTGSRSISYTSPNIAAACQILVFIESYSAELQP